MKIFDPRGRRKRKAALERMLAQRRCPEVSCQWEPSTVKVRATSLVFISQVGDIMDLTRNGTEGDHNDVGSMMEEALVNSNVSIMSAITEQTEGLTINGGKHPSKPRSPVLPGEYHQPSNIQILLCWNR